MPQQNAILFGGVLAAALAAGVAGVAARAGAGGQDARPAERPRDERPARDPRFLGPDGARAIRLDGRGSQIGVTVSDPDGQDATGVRIDSVDEASPAAKAGLREGDVVVTFDGERVRSARQLTRLVQETPDGRQVAMTITRSGASQTLTITPEASAAAWNYPINGPEIREQVERSLRGLQLPELGGPMFDFRFDGMPGAGPRGRLGVQVDALSDQLAEYFGVKGGGVLVSGVTPGSAAEKAGLKAGDVITAVNGTAVRDTGELVEELREAGSAGPVAIDVVRDKQTRSLTATLDAPAAPRRPRRPA
jgi:serine protease Do